jgi:hypothetical protein
MDQASQNKTRAANIRAVWDALLAPKWDRDVLINLGKALYARRPLKDLDTKLFDELLPRLVEIVERLEGKFAPPPHEKKPDEDDTEGVRSLPTGESGQEDPSKPPTNSPSTQKPNVPPPSDTLLPDVTSTQRK